MVHGVSGFGEPVRKLTIPPRKLRRTVSTDPHGSLFDDTTQVIDDLEDVKVSVQK